MIKTSSSSKESSLSFNLGALILSSEELSTVDNTAHAGLATYSDVALNVENPNSFTF